MYGSVHLSHWVNIQVWLYYGFTSGTHTSSRWDRWQRIYAERVSHCWVVSPWSITMAEARSRVAYHEEPRLWVAAYTVKPGSNTQTYTDADSMQYRRVVWSSVWICLVQRLLYQPRQTEDSAWYACGPGRCEFLGPWLVSVGHWRVF